MQTKRNNSTTSQVVLKLLKLMEGLICNAGENLTYSVMC